MYRYWWWVSSNGQFGNLFNVINSQQYGSSLSFIRMAFALEPNFFPLIRSDIIGYSECDDMVIVTPAWLLDFLNYSAYCTYCLQHIFVRAF